MTGTLCIHDNYAINKIVMQIHQTLNWTLEIQHSDKIFYLFQKFFRIISIPIISVTAELYYKKKEKMF